MSETESSTASAAEIKIENKAGIATNTAATCAVATYYSTTNATTEVLAECSDDEEYDKLGFTFGNYWSPHPADVAELYEAFSKTNALELSWKCPGRRNPIQEEKQEIKKEEPVVTSMRSEPTATGFDFEEESTPLMRRVPGKTVALKTSAKRKTTCLTGILANMERHRIMDQMAEDIPNPNPTTPITNNTATTSFDTTAQ